MKASYCRRRSERLPEDTRLTRACPTCGTNVAFGTEPSEMHRILKTARARYPAFPVPSSEPLARAMRMDKSAR